LSKILFLKRTRDQNINIQQKTRIKASKWGFPLLLGGNADTVNQYVSAPTRPPIQHLWVTGSQWSDYEVQILAPIKLSILATIKTSI
jgi:hypothetical protein